MKCDKRVSVAELPIIWVPVLCIMWSKYPPRLGMLLYILSRLGIVCLGLASAKAWHASLYLSCLGSICRSLACDSISCHALAVFGMLFYILSRLGSICRGLACYSISCHVLAVSAEAWHAILYLITSYALAVSAELSMLFYVLSRLGSICWGLACYHSIPYLITIQDSNPGRVPLFIPGLKKISTWWIDFLSGFRDWCLV